MLRFSVSLTDNILRENRHMCRPVLFYCLVCPFLGKEVPWTYLSRTLNVTNLWRCCSLLKINHLSGTLSIEQSETEAGGGMNHSTLHNMLSF